MITLGELVRLSAAAHTDPRLVCNENRKHQARNWQCILQNPQRDTEELNNQAEEEKYDNDRRAPVVGA
ncbi:hypothetical protein HMPREF3042_09935 [Corynebacterium sp. HMSC074C05]|nr:hypothetical protein HMPREF3042_09935 [Corynebacterium sp. HMSC074C05]